MTNPIVLDGMWYAVGETVQVFLAGLDCGDFTVAADGTVTVPYGSDPDAVLTAQYLKDMSDAVSPVVKPFAGLEFLTTLTVQISGVATVVTVPCIIGFTYTSAGQLVRPNTQTDSKSKQGPTLGETRRIEQFAVLVAATPYNVAFGIDFDHTIPAVFRDTDQTTALLKSVAFSGVYQETLEGDYNYDNMFCWGLSRPVMCNISAIEGFMGTEER